MIDSIQALTQAGLLQTRLLAPTSRYYALATVVLTTAGGVEIAYLERRFLPQPETLSQIGTHAVAAGERLDQIAAAFLGDPEQFWRLCDANRAMRPAELTAVVGRSLRITLPAGFAGA
jgi:hypothetical protein